MIHALLLLQAVTPEPDERGFGQTILDFIDSPAPYSPFSEYLLLLFILWLIARRENRKQTFDTQAQEVLDDKYEKGELSKQAYEKHRQNLIVRPKR